MTIRINHILNSTLMLPILILNNQNINSQVLVSTSKLVNDSFAFTLQNTTKNTYKVILESSLNNKNGKLLYKESSSEFNLAPGVTVITEKETGNIVSKFYDEEFLISLLKPISSNIESCNLTLSVRQKFGPELGSQKIEL